MHDRKGQHVACMRGLHKSFDDQKRHDSSFGGVRRYRASCSGYACAYCFRVHISLASLSFGDYHTYTPKVASVVLQITTLALSSRMREHGSTS